jgi:hypothetical protein
MQRIRDKNVDRWMFGYLRDLFDKGIRRKQRRGDRVRHVLFALCDHYEPLWAGPHGKADFEVGLRRVERWHAAYPKLAEQFRDSDGVAPQHTFFFPAEEYEHRFFDHLDDLVRRDYGEVELHLHHSNDTEESLERTIRSALELYGRRGHFARTAEGQMHYGFIHGNWALANGRPDGQSCGVDAELPLLFRTGCYADFTFPSCPDITQPNIVNQIYWPTGDLSRKRSYESGRQARVGESFDDRLLIITGPLVVGFRGDTLQPRLEYGAILGNDPVTKYRVRHWVKAGVHVLGQPDWLFIKVYTHGAQDNQANALLGDGGRQLHEQLQLLNDGVESCLHYVTAREMFNIARAAIDGKTGNPRDYRDYLLPRPPVRTKRSQ